MDYLVVSTFVTDRVTLADGRYYGEFPGGAGLYALCGLGVWSKSALLVTGVGRDFNNSYNEWFEKSGLSASGLIIRDEHTAVSQVYYHNDGERTEVPLYGEEHYRKLEAGPDDLAAYCDGLKGMYVFKDFGPPGYWDELLALKNRYGFCLLWELNASIMTPENISQIRRIAEGLDILSLNQSECRALFNESDLEACVHILSGWKVPMIYLRKGAEGALILKDGRTYAIPAVQDTLVVDVTGGGNASSAALLHGVCQNMSPYECGVLAGVSAALCISQYGPPLLDASATKKAELLRAQFLRC